MRRHYSDETVTVWHGDSLDVLPTLPEASFDAVVTDPPYGIAFMGKAWDQPGEFGSRSRRGGGPNKTRGEADAALEAGRYDLSPHAMGNFQRWCEAWARECYRLLKPGGHLLAFGGSRTWHRLAAGVEDAGFEIRDSIAWLYGSGFPKSLDVAKAIDKAHGAEREREAPRTRARPSDAIHASGFGADGWSPQVKTAVTAAAAAWAGWGTALKPSFEPVVVARKPLAGTVAGNVLTHGTGALNIDACRVSTRRYTERGASDLAALPGPRAGAANGRWPTNVVLDDVTAAELDRQAPDAGASGKASGPTLRDPQTATVAYGARRGLTGEPAFYGDEGGASRFFPTFRYEAKAPTSERPRDGDVAHPTVKPLDLMRWLVRLVTPPAGLILDPFAGSGPTGEAAIVEGFRAVLVEREADYLPLIMSRLTKPIEPVLDLGALA